MSKKYYIVKDQENELTGGFIPFKVLNYSPYQINPNMIFPTNNVAQVSLDGKPIPPQVISTQPNFTSPIFGQNTPQFFNNPLGTPIGSQGISAVVNPTLFSAVKSQPSMVPTINPLPIPNKSLFNVSTTPTTVIPAPIFGPPIIKTGPFYQQQMPGLIKVMVGSDIVNINIPFNQFRNIINDIYFRSQTNNTDLKATFIINGPGLNTSIQTSYSNMVQILNHIRKTYGDVTVTSNNSIPF